MTTTVKDNFNDSFPAAPAGNVNVKWQSDAAGTYPRRVSAYVPMSGGSGGGIVCVEVSLAPTMPGNFTVAHGLESTPLFVLIQMDSNGEIWFQTPTRYDATNLYLVASGFTPSSPGNARAQCFMAAADKEVALAPVAPGNFQVAHGLGYTPAAVYIQMTSGGEIWYQTPKADSTYLYLTASDAGITGNAECFRGIPAFQVVLHEQVLLDPMAPGDFTVAHGFSVLPRLAIIRMTSGGEIWFQSPTRYDATNLYLVASDFSATEPITGYCDLWG